MVPAEGFSDAHLLLPKSQSRLSPISMKQEMPHSWTTVIYCTLATLEDNLENTTGSVHGYLTISKASLCFPGTSEAVFYKHFPAEAHLKKLEAHLTIL